MYEFLPILKKFTVLSSSGLTLPVYASIVRPYSFSISYASEIFLYFSAGEASGLFIKFLRPATLCLLSSIKKGTSSSTNVSRASIILNIKGITDRVKLLIRAISCSILTIFLSCLSISISSWSLY